MSASYQDRQYIPPAPGQLPEAYSPLIDKLNTLRQRWAAATDAANAARRALREAPEAYRVAVTAAAAEGKDVAKVPDPRGPAAEEFELREIAERGLQHEVIAAWAELWNAVTADHAEVLAHVDRPCEQTTAEVRDLEAQLAAARSRLADALGVRRWVVSRRVGTDLDGARRRSARPQPMDGADGDTLARLRSDEAKAAALEDQAEKVRTESLERQRHEAEKEQRRLEERKARRAAARS
jgi:hypothetical protein